MEAILVAVVVVAPIFDYTHGFHDAANAVAEGLVEPVAVTSPVMLGGLVGAIAWNLLTRWWAIPASGSRCLMGGMSGAVLATAGSDQVQSSGILEKVLVPTLAAPLVGFSVGIALMAVLLWIFEHARFPRIQRRFRYAQLASAITIGVGNDGVGERIVRTLGTRLVKLAPSQGFAAETAASSVLPAAACALAARAIFVG